MLNSNLLVVAVFCEYLLKNINGVTGKKQKVWIEIRDRAIQKPKQNQNQPQHPPTTSLQ